MSAQPTEPPTPTTPPRRPRRRRWPTPPPGSPRPTPASTATSAAGSPSCWPATGPSWPTTWAWARPARRSIALREAARSGPLLVVCPAGVKLTWQRELRAVEPDADVRVVTAAADWEPGHRWTVVNYDLLGRLEAALLAVPWAGVIVDEAHYIKNDSQRAARVLRLLGEATGRGPAPAADPEYVYLLTGTPMSNRPRDLFNLLKAVRHPLAKSFYTYARRYCAAVDNGYGLDTTGRLQPGGTGRARLRGDAAPHQGRGARPAPQGARLAAGRPARRGARRPSGAWRRGPSTTWRRTPPAAGLRGSSSWGCSTGAATSWPWPRPPARSRPPGSGSRPGRRWSSSPPTRR